jgi:anti-anti-sigma factor
MSLTVKIENRMPGCYVVKFIGRLDGTTYAECDEKISPLLVPETKTLMFDMTNLDYISSMGLRTIIKARQFIEGNGGSVSMMKMQSQIEKVFKVANLLNGIMLFASTKEADDYFDEMQKKILDSLR